MKRVLGLIFLALSLFVPIGAIALAFYSATTQTACKAGGSIFFGPPDYVYSTTCTFSDRLFHSLKTESLPVVYFFAPLIIIGLVLSFVLLRKLPIQQQTLQKPLTK